MKLTLDAAATQVGVSKSTLLRAIKRGDLSAEKHGDRAFVVDQSEVGRWASARASAAPASPDDEPRHVLTQAAPAPDVTQEAASWRIKAEMLERMLTLADATIADLRSRLDRSEAEAADARSKALDSLMAMLPRMIPPPEQPKAEPAPVTEPPRGWMARVLGR